MRAFEAVLNGKCLCVAGIPGDGVLTALVASIQRSGRNELQLTVAGLVSATGEHVTWKIAPLEVGAEVQVRVVEALAVDEPSRTPSDPQRDIEAQKNYVRQMANRFGWTLVESGKS